MLPISFLASKRSPLSNTTTNVLFGRAGITTGTSFGEQDTRHMAESAYNNCFIPVKVGGISVLMKLFNSYLTRDKTTPPANAVSKIVSRLALIRCSSEG